jgi:hypothetical protein
MQGYNSKGKRKVDPVASRPTVVPLQFSEGPNGPSVASKKSARKDKRNKKYKIKVSYPKPHWSHIGIHVSSAPDKERT